MQFQRCSANRRQEEFQIIQYKILNSHCPVDLPIDERLRKLWTSEELWTVKDLETIIKRWKDNSGKPQLSDTESTLELLNDFLQIVIAFVQNNFTGPFDRVTPCNELLSNLQLDDLAALDQLKANGEELNPNVKTAQLFLIAKQMLEYLTTANPTSKVTCGRTIVFDIH